MVNNKENPAPVTSDENSGQENSSGESQKSRLALAGRLNIIIPSVFVLLCAVVVCFLLMGEIRYANSVQGKFVCSSSSDSGAYMVFNRDGSYEFFEDGKSTPDRGSWEMNSGKILLSENGSDDSEIMYYIDNKYIAFYDDSFLAGDVPQKSAFDAQFTASDGTVYVFESDGKCYTSEDGRNTELGGYITDGNFIVITIENTTHTYLNCGDGITPVYFTQA